MIAKPVSMNVYDRLMQLVATLLDFHKYFNVKTFCSAFMETVAACACSCFPPIDMYTDDGNTSTEQKKGKITYFF